MKTVIADISLKEDFLFFLSQPLFYLYGSAHFFIFNYPKEKKGWRERDLCFPTETVKYIPKLLLFLIYRSPHV